MGDPSVCKNHITPRVDAFLKCDERAKVLAHLAGVVTRHIDELRAHLDLTQRQVLLHVSTRLCICKHKVGIVITVWAAL